MTLLVRDEQDILRENLEFHLGRGVDEIVLMDNLSTDATEEIAREYERAGVLHYMFQPQDDYAQGRWVTQMAHRAAGELQADWVINGDADEFWWPESGSLKDALTAVDADVVAASAGRTNFVARPDGPGPFWRRMDVHHATSLNAIGLPLPGKVAHRGRGDIVVDQGNHVVRLGGEPVPSVPAPVTILHFPVRSRAQYRNKIVKGGAAYARNGELDRSAGATWRHLYEKHLDGTFDRAYEDEVFDDRRIAEGLATGALLRDERLKHALEALAR